MCWVVFEPNKEIMTDGGENVIKRRKKHRDLVMADEIVDVLIQFQRLVMVVVKARQNEREEVFFILMFSGVSVSCCAGQLKSSQKNSHEKLEILHTMPLRTD